MKFPNASGVRVNMMYPTDNDYWTKLKAFVDYEPVTAITPELRGVLASIGIIKGEPFEPTTRQQELLQKAVETAPKMILALRQLSREDGRFTTRTGSTNAPGPQGRPSGCRKATWTLTSARHSSSTPIPLPRRW